MTDMIVRIVCGTLGAIGFSIMFYVKPRHIPLGALGALITCGVYLLCIRFVSGEFVSNLLGAFAGAIYAEIGARITKTPVPVYMLPAIITLAPGGHLYNTMRCLLAASYDEALAYATLTLQVSLGIAGGVIVASLFGMFLRAILKRKKKI